MDDLISRQAAIDACLKGKTDGLPATNVACDCCAERIRVLPSADVQPTLYGYKIEHLAYIARVMEKEGITAEDAARTFDDLGRAVSWVIDEALQKMEEAIHDHNTGSI